MTSLFYIRMHLVNFNVFSCFVFFFFFCFRLCFLLLLLLFFYFIFFLSQVILDIQQVPLIGTSLHYYFSFSVSSSYYNEKRA